MNTFEASQGVVDEAARACANNLVKWFGGIEEAIAALEAEPVTMTEIAMTAHIEQQRQFALKAHMNQRAFSRLVLDQLT